MGHIRYFLKFANNIIVQFVEIIVFFHKNCLDKIKVYKVILPGPEIRFEHKLAQLSFIYLQYVHDQTALAAVHVTFCRLMSNLFEPLASLARFAKSPDLKVVNQD